MRYITVRDLNTKPKEVWEKIKEADVVVTSNGKPIAILTGATEATLESQLCALRRSRALMAMEDMQKTAADKGLDRWPEKKIEDEIRAVRKTRRT
jgi:antitoxin (DNA-binding transcriptional repressor) of toxin-antitoxin stability system